MAASVIYLTLRGGAGQDRGMGADGAVVARLAEKFSEFRPHADERGWRFYLGSEARAYARKVFVILGRRRGRARAGQRSANGTGCTVCNSLSMSSCVIFPVAPGTVESMKRNWCPRSSKARKATGAPLAGSPN